MPLLLQGMRQIALIAIAIISATTAAIIVISTTTIMTTTITTNTTAIAIVIMIMIMIVLPLLLLLIIIIIVQEVQEKSRAREDSCGECVICREDFKNEDQILLSCSHVFHKQCIDAFERFAKVRMMAVNQLAAPLTAKRIPKFALWQNLHPPPLPPSGPS